MRSCWLLGHLLRLLALLKAGKFLTFVKEVFSLRADSNDDLKLDDFKATLGEFVHYAKRFASEPSTNPVGRSQIK